MRAPDLNKSKDDVETTNIFNVPNETQVTGCIYCAMMGTVDNPTVIYHYSGSSYCLDHLMGVVNGAQ